MTRNPAASSSRTTSRRWRRRSRKSFDFHAPASANARSPNAVLEPWWRTTSRSIARSSTTRMAEDMIGYYVHHHGRGHLARATSICAHLREPVTFLSSIDMPDQRHRNTVRLPRDDRAPTFSDPSANGTLHWAPLHDSGLRERMGLIAAWVTATKPNVMVVDVSVEVAMLVRLLGVPVVVMAMPGDRIDAPHDLVYQAADHILAAWPRELYEPPWLREHSAKTTYVGGISRFDGRAPNAAIAQSRPECACSQRCRWFHAGLGGRKTLRRCASDSCDGHPLVWRAVRGQRIRGRLCAPPTW